jgi:hypothetical protein
MARSTFSSTRNKAAISLDRSAGMISSLSGPPLPRLVSVKPKGNEPRGKAGKAAVHKQKDRPKEVFGLNFVQVVMFVPRGSILAISAFVCLRCDPAPIRHALGKRRAAIHRTARIFSILVRTIFQADFVPLTSTHCVSGHGRVEDEKKEYRETG